MTDIPMQRYCIECGNLITDNYGFCPACGRSYESPKVENTGSGNVRNEQVRGPSPEEVAQVQQAYQKYAEEYRRRVIENQWKMNIFMIGIWTIISGLMATSLALDMPYIAPSLNSFFGFGDHADVEATVLTISCVFAAISLIFNFLKKYWTVALVTCALSTVSTLGLLYCNDTVCIYLFLFGFLASLRIKNIRRVFQ